MTPTDAGSVPRPAGNRPACLARRAGRSRRRPRRRRGRAGHVRDHRRHPRVGRGPPRRPLRRPARRAHARRPVRRRRRGARRRRRPHRPDRPAGRRRATGLPVCVVDDPRAVLGAVADRVYGEPSRRLTVIGITGTNGKTTTAYLVEAGLAAAGLGTGLIGTVQTRTRGRDADGTPTVTALPERPHHPGGARAARPAGRRWPRPGSRPWSWRSPATRSCSAGSAASGSPPPASPTSAATTWTSTATSRTTSRPRRCSSTAAPPREVVDVDDDGRPPAGRRSAPDAGHRVDRRRRADWTATDVAPGARRRLHLHPARPGGAHVAGPAAAARAGSTSPTPSSPSRCSTPSGCRSRRRWPGSPRPSSPAGWSRSTPGQPFVAVVDYAHTPDAVSHRPRRAARRHDRPADHRARLRRRPRSGKAAGDGDRCGRRQRCTDRDRRQPTLRGPRRHPRGHARRRPGGARGPARRGARGRRPPRRAGRRRRAWPARATPCWWPARDTRPARRSRAPCTRSTTARCSARSSPASGDAAHDRADAWPRSPQLVGRRR